MSQISGRKNGGGELIFCEGTKHGRGQVVLVNKNFHFDWNIEKIEDRVIQLNIKADKDMSIFNVYAPSGQGETKTFLENLKTNIDKCETDIKIICGDLRKFKLIKILKD